MRTFPKNCKHLNIDFCNARGLFENFGKLEDGVSKFSNISIFGRNQMNEPCEAFCIFNSLKYYYSMAKSGLLSK